MNSETVHFVATDPPFNKSRDFHATSDSLADGASIQGRVRSMGSCWSCSAPFVGAAGATTTSIRSSWRLNHIRPKSDGEIDAYDNLTLLCPPCNRVKMDRMTLTDLQSQNRRDKHLLPENEQNLKLGQGSPKRRAQAIRQYAHTRIFAAPRPTPLEKGLGGLKDAAQRLRCLKILARFTARAGMTAWIGGQSCKKEYHRMSVLPVIT